MISSYNTVKGFKGVKGVLVLKVCAVLFLEVFRVFSSGRVLLYTVFMASPLPKTLVKTLAKNLVKNLAKNLA